MVMALARLRRRDRIISHKDTSILTLITKKVSQALFLQMAMKLKSPRSDLQKANCTSVRKMKKKCFDDLVLYIEMIFIIRGNTDPSFGCMWCGVGQNSFQIRTKVH